MTITICANGLIMIPVKIMCKTTSVQNILSSAAHKRKTDA